MRFRSMQERRADLLGDPQLQELFAARPGLLRVVDAYLWSYPRSPSRSRRSLLLVGGIGLALVLGLAGCWRMRRS